MMHLVDLYIALRRAIGFKLKGTERHLRQFAAFAAERGETRIRTETVIAWASRAQTPHMRHIRMGDLIRFARHVRAESPEHELPPRDIFPSVWRPRPPHILTRDELTAILDAAGHLRPYGTSRPATYQTLFALIAVTGLRLGEALRLGMSDLTADGLVVRETKFRKSRLLPLHPTTRAALKAYLNKWRPFADRDEPLFNVVGRGALKPSTVEAVFLSIVRSLGLRRAAGSPDSSSRGVRIHDFRHTFAVRALEACPQGRAAINRHMLALTTYLGHTLVRYTYWYLHVSPELMTDIADACELLEAGGDQ